MPEDAPQSLLGPMITAFAALGPRHARSRHRLVAHLGGGDRGQQRVRVRLELPLVLPIFGSMGALGALTVFTSDRMKGVLEYLMAYGFSPRGIFTYFLVATLVAVSIVLAVSIADRCGSLPRPGNPVTTALVLLLGLYAIPMSFVSAAFSTTVSMYLVGARLASRGPQQSDRHRSVPRYRPPGSHGGHDRRLRGYGRDHHRWTPFHLWSPPHHRHPGRPPALGEHRPAAAPGAVPLGLVSRRTMTSTNLSGAASPGVGGAPPRSRAVRSPPDISGLKS